VAAVDVAGDAVQYKYVLLDADGWVAKWEEGPNREVPATGHGPVVVHDEAFSGIAEWRGAGVTVPVFSLRTAEDLGVGQFTDLIPFSDWAAEAGLSMIQLLPVNDTVLNHDWDDSYPYTPVSVHALHPLYLDLAAIAGGGIAAAIGDARSELNGLSQIDFPRVMETKTRLARAAYVNLGETLEDNSEFDEFVDEHWEWLGPYSAWSVNRDRYGTPDFTQWGEAATYTLEQVDSMATPGGPDYDDLRYHWFVQFHLHRQFKAAADHVRSRGIALKGDLPIGVAPESVEVWTRSELFHVGAQTGAPPDGFARLGQNWGFPTYNWDRMAEDGFAWWQSRLQAIAEYVDAYRLDHILGFFRIWEIPAGDYDAIAGHFRPSLPLMAKEIEQALGEIDAAALARPPMGVAELNERFGDVADDVAARFIKVASGGEATVESQKQIRAAFAAGAFAALDDAERVELERRLLNFAVDVLLVDVEGGFAPAIAWQDSTHYARLASIQRERFDALAVDFFHHRHAALWEEHGRRLLPVIVDATGLLACGEDLGMVPDVVPDVMNEIGLLSLEIERMPKRIGEWVADPANAPYLTVISPGSHDTKTLRQWWEVDSALRVRYWETVLDRSGEPPAEATAVVVTAIVERQLASPAMLCIIPIADLLAIDPELRRDDVASERINDPADRHNKWRYRMDPTVEDLKAAADFTGRLGSLIRLAGR
jgi:4-alpha-glucanotransferase